MKLSKRLRHLSSVSGGGVKELLVFKHPTAGVQIPAGTVERDEDIETAVKREVYEETGLQLVEIENYLGCFENELEKNQRIIAETTQVICRTQLNRNSLQTKTSQGTYRRLSFPQERILQRFPILNMNITNFTQPIRIDTNITGWIPNENLSAQKKRHFFLMFTQEETAMRGN